MGKPSEEELNQALAVARYMRESGKDPYSLAKALLHLHYRTGLLEHVMQAAVAYLHSGLAEHEHTQLMRAIEAVEQAERRGVGDTPDTLGLG